MDTGLAPRRHRPLVIALLLATLMFGMALRLYDLDGESLWHDEIATAKKAELDLQSLLTLLARAEGKPGRAPLMFTISHFFIVLFGDSEFILRFQAMLFGSLSILLAYKVGEILWTKDEGLVVALLLALNAYHVRYSQEARHYALMVFLALLSLIFLLQALQKNQKRLWIGYVLCTSLSLYNHYFGFLLLGAEVIFGAWVIAQNSLSYRREDIRKSEGRASRSQPTSAKQVVAFCVSLALVAVSYLPWLSTLRSVIATQVGSELGAVSLASLRLSLSFLCTVFTDYSSAYGAAILLWLAAFLLGLVTSGYRKAVLVVLWIGMPFAFLFVIAPKHFVRPRHVLFILPLYLIAIARGITSTRFWLDRLLRSMKGHRGWSVTVGVSFVLLAFALLSIVPLRAYYLSQKADWRGAAAYLAGNVLPGDIVVVDGKTYGGAQDAPWVERCLPYYLGRYEIEGTPVLRVGRGFWEDLQRVQEGHGQVWAVLKYNDRPPASWGKMPGITVIDFYRVPLVRLNQTSGDLV